MWFVYLKKTFLLYSVSDVHSRFYQFNTELPHLKTHVEEEYSNQFIYCFQQTFSTDEQTLNIFY